MRTSSVDKSTRISCEREDRIWGRRWGPTSKLSTRIICEREGSDFSEKTRTSLEAEYEDHLQARGIRLQREDEDQPRSWVRGSTANERDQTWAGRRGPASKRENEDQLEREDQTWARRRGPASRHNSYEREDQASAGREGSTLVNEGTRTAICERKIGICKTRQRRSKFKRAEGNQ